MLILTRRPVESIYIGEEVTVTVLGVVGNQVRFGIEAPRNIVVDRAEIHERKKRALLNGGNHVNGHPPPDAEPNGNTRIDPDDDDVALAKDAHADRNVAPLKLRR